MGRPAKVPKAKRNAFTRQERLGDTYSITAEAVQEIITETGNMPTTGEPYIPADFPLAKRLNNIRFFLESEHELEIESLTPGEEKKYLERLKARSEEFVRVFKDMPESTLFKLADKGDLFSYVDTSTGESEFSKLNTIEKTLERLNAAIENTVKDLEGTRASPKEGLRRVVGELAQIFHDATDRSPGVSRDKYDEPAGPFFRFVKVCINHFSIRDKSRITDRSIEKAINAINTK